MPEYPISGQKHVKEALFSYTCLFIRFRTCRRSVFSFHMPVYPVSNMQEKYSPVSHAFNPPKRHVRREKWGAHMLFASRRGMRGEKNAVLTCFLHAGEACGREKWGAYMLSSLQVAHFISGETCRAGKTMCRMPCCVKKPGQKEVPGQ